MDLPRLTPIVGFLDVHGRGAERFERDDQVSHVEFRLQIQLNGRVFLAVGRLPPCTVLAGAFLARRLHPVYDILDPMGGPRTAPGAFSGGIAPETFLRVIGVIQMRQNTIAFFSVEAARRGRL